MERPDTRRLRYLMQNGPDGFLNVEKDRYEFALEIAEQAGRDEPNEMDELNGFRLLIDAAMAADIEEEKRMIFSFSHPPSKNNLNPATTETP